mgnify:CR=1 FL=1|jgi:hypothetical protein|tara:strand:- start:342 stop:494 length:153 start_codon:yes stop_codon:yes gene_type:complete
MKTRQAKFEDSEGTVHSPIINYTDESDYDAQVAQFATDSGTTYLGEYQEL